MTRIPCVFAQLLKLLPFDHFEHLVDIMGANRGVKTLPAWAHLVCMAYAQLTRREGLRDLVACLNSHRHQLYHIGIRHRITRSTLADAAQRRGWQLFEALGQRLITMALDLHKDDAIALDLQEPLYAMDSTTITLCMNLFTWAHFRTTKSAIKAHTLLDLRGTIPIFVSITNANVADSKLLNNLPLKANDTVVLDRGYIDFARLYGLNQRKVRFVVRAKKSLRYQHIKSQPVDTSSGLRADEVVCLAKDTSYAQYPKRLRRVEFYDEINRLDLVFLTNRWDVPALTIAQIYKQRWQVELFFKWLKQNLSIKHFFGTSENAVKAQLWTAICVYLMVLIGHKRLKLSISLQLFMHLIEANMFEKTTLVDLVASADSYDLEVAENTQIVLF